MGNIIYDDEGDYCYECTVYGDDYYLDDNGELELVCSFFGCPHLVRVDNKINVLLGD